MAAVAPDPKMAGMEMQQQGYPPPGEAQYQPPPPGYAAPPGYAQQPVQPGYPQPLQPGQQQTVVVAGMQPTMVIVDSKPADHFGFALFTCMCCFWPTGIVALIFSCQVDSKWNSGDREGAKSASSNANLFSKISLGIGIAALIIVLIIIPVYFVVILPAQIIGSVVG
ncbi:proline-rich transmembrane protein 1-like [Branchiostoma floridae x Branchiostoma belcheri]